MELIVIGSGSDGNSYALVGNDEILILDAGLPLKSVLKSINYEIRKVVGVVVTHEHKDHDGHSNEFKELGIPVFRPFAGDTKLVLKNNSKFFLSKFPLIHDVDNYGYYISHPEMGNLVYITDTEFCQWKFSEVNHFLVEANYQRAYVDRTHAALEHIYFGHMEYNTTREFIASNKTDDLRNVIVCHLSKNNADPSFIAKDLKGVVGEHVNTEVAIPGLVVELNKEPF